MQLLLTIPAFIITFLSVRYKVLNNYRRWKKEEYNIRHGHEWRLMALANLPSIALLAIAAGALHQPVLKAGLLAFFSGLMIAFFIWLVFDAWYNSKRGFTMFSLGSKDEDDPVTDKILRLFPEAVRAIIKIVLLAASVFFYIKFFIKN